MGSTVGCVDCKLKFSYAQNIQEHATGDGSQFFTTRRAVPCSGRRVGAARPRGSSPPRSISPKQPVVRAHVQVRRSGASAPPLTVFAHAGGPSCGGLLGPITQSAASGGGYSQHMQTLVAAPKRSTTRVCCTSTLYRRPSRAKHLGLAWTLKPKVHSVTFLVQFGSHPTSVLRTDLVGSFP